MDSIEKRLDGIEQSLDRVEQRLDNVEERLSALKKDMVEVTSDIKKPTRRMNAIYDQVAFLIEFRTKMLMFKDEKKID